MRKLLLLLLALLAFSVAGRAQGNNFGIPGATGTSLPTSCRAPSLFVLTASGASNGLVYSCQSNIYVLLTASGGSGSVGSGTQYQPCIYQGSGTTTTCSGLTGYIFNPATGLFIPAPTGTGTAFSVTGDSNGSNIASFFLTGGGLGAWIDNLGGIHGTSGDFGAGLGQGCVSLYDPTGTKYSNVCGPNANLAANYEMDLPVVPSAGFLYFDGFQTTTFSPAPASSANGLSSGGQVFCSTTTLVCTISAATFVLNGVSYSSPQTDVTLVADGTFPRIDTFYVGCTLSGGVCDGTNVGIANFIGGTPAGSPAAPSVDPTIEIEVGFVTVAALATNPTVTDETIYLDDAGPAAEWTMSKTGAGINLAGTTACFAASSKCIIGTAVTAGQFFKGVRGSGTVTPSNYNVLNLQLKSAATWPKNKCLNVAFYNSTVLVGNAVSICNGSFAFNSSQTSTYQQIAIAASLFNANTAVDTVIFTAVGGGAAFSWTVDNIQLQSGITSTPPPGFPALNQVLNPTASKVFAMGGYDLAFSNLATSSLYGVKFDGGITNSFTDITPQSTGSERITLNFDANPHENIIAFDHANSIGDWAILDNDEGASAYEFSLLEQTNSTYKIEVFQGTAGDIALNQSGGGVAIGAKHITSGFDLDVATTATNGGTIKGKTLTLGTDNSTAGTVTTSNSAANAHTVWGSGATTTNTINGFATAPTTGHAVTCTTSSTTCTLTDSGITLGVPDKRRVCAMVVGADNAASVIADADLGPQANRCFIPYAATLVEMDVDADAGTPNVIAQKRHCSTYTTGKCSAWTDSDLVSSALAATTGGFPSCSNTGGTTGLDGGTTCSATLQNTAIAIGDYLQLKSGTAGGVAKRLTITLIFTVN